ncbi:hypothetical protein GCM10009760_47990 [Kitasatospora kazusensis]|uniref:Uncharacterized protein n=1 Tax=Kitasatospora kazusensis TaxID=407974 RepID=A0ABN3A247_9ACTN
MRPALGTAVLGLRGERLPAVRLPVEGTAAVRLRAEGLVTVGLGRLGRERHQLATAFRSCWNAV